MKQKSFKESFCVISLLALVLAVAFYDVVFLGKTLKMTTANPQALITGPYGQEKNKPAFFPVHSTDAIIFEEPLLEFIKQSLRKGEFPFWNPYQGGGYPLIGMMHVGIFWPLHFLVYLLPQVWGWDVMLLCRYLLAGWLTFLFMRGLRFGFLPALGAGVAFMLSGPMILSQWAFVNVDVLTPLVLLSLEYLIRKPDLKRLVFTAFAVGLMFLAGHPEHIFLVNVFAVLFFVFRMLTLRRPRPAYKRVVAHFLGAYVLAAGLSAFVAFPFLFNWVMEFWHSHPTHLGSLVEAAGIMKEALITFVVPSFFQKEPVTMNFDRYSFWGHIGVIPLGLVFFSLFRKQKQGLNYFFLFVAFVIFMKSHVRFPLVNWIGYLPLFNICRFYHHTAHLFAFSFSVLVGMGLRAVLAQRHVLKKGSVYIFLLGALLGAALFYYRGAAHFSQSVRTSFFGFGVLATFGALLFLKERKVFKKQLWAALFVAVMATELFFYIPREHVKRFNSFPTVPYIEFLKNAPEKARAFGVFWTFYPNTATGYQVEDLGIASGVLFKRYVHFINNFVYEGFFQKDYGSSAFWVVPVTFLGKSAPYLDLMNVKYTVAAKDFSRMFPPARQSDFQKPIYSKEVNIYSRPNTLPRAFVVHRVLFEPDESLVVKKMKEISRNFRDTAILEHSLVPEINSSLANIPLVDRSSADIVKYAANEVIVRAKMENPGLLILGDNFHPEWKAFVNKRPAKIYRADYLFRAVFLAAGEQEVRFCFRPVSFYAGAAVSLLSLLVALLLLRARKTAP